MTIDPLILPQLYPVLALGVERFGERQGRMSAEAEIDQILDFPKSSECIALKVVIVVVDNLEAPFEGGGHKKSKRGSQYQSELTPESATLT